MKIKINKFLSLGIIATAAFLSSCERGEEWTSSDGKGDVIIKMLNAGEKVLAFDALSNPQTALLVDIRKDAPSEAALNAPTTVQVSFDQAYLDAYNDENGTAYELLPSDLYTTDIPAGPTGFTINMAAGQFAAPINFTLTDATKLDFSKQYAFPLTISSVDGNGKISESKTAFVKVLVKNEWDGAYEVTGTMKDEGAALGGLFPMNYHLITSGANTVDGYDPDYWVDYFIPIMSGADVSGYGGYSPVFEFDPATNKIVKVTNIYGQPASNTRSAGLDPSGENSYDPDTQTIKVKFFMYQPSVITTAPHIRVYFDWTLKRTGDR
ncbi:DUF1735 domain-containing protein [Flavihumibacter sp. UBA7668]|uniref:DUF1735 domain-containing protein n=1 Tax=Flavihumibacter sp. UBA7668 TaxID=1946542 RepID=UPI0025BE61C1|nr:DUF1735 domain-containing protein [Flavihumibacter sp. UBA7668]